MQEKTILPSCNMLKLICLQIHKPGPDINFAVTKTYYESMLIFFSSKLYLKHHIDNRNGFTIPMPSKIKKIFFFLLLVYVSLMKNIQGGQRIARSRANIFNSYYPKVNNL